MSYIFVIQSPASDWLTSPHSALSISHLGNHRPHTGTTGPKAVFHVWDRLFARVRMEFSGTARRWALLYPLNHFAGLQVFLHAIRNGLFLAVPKSRQLTDVFECMIRHKVESASATPEFWRMFVSQLDPATASQFHLRQITLGGEPATAEILGRLRELFPALDSHTSTQPPK